MQGEEGISKEVRWVGKFSNFLSQGLDRLKIRVQFLAHLTHSYWSNQYRILKFNE